MDVALPARHVSFSVAIEQPSGVGEVRRVALDLAEALHFNAPEIDRAVQVVSEAATNILKHARRGEILLRASAPEAPPSLEILALDQGPGMGNVANALRDGFSTSGSPGLGLGAIARISNFFEISSAPNKGTALVARIDANAPGRPLQNDPNLPGLEWGVVCVPKPGEEVCGDAWAVKAGAARDSVLLVDGLGHGIPASEAAGQALHAFERCAGERPETSLKILHEAMSQTRGAVAAIAEIDWRERTFRYAGAGNIAASLVPVKGAAYNMVSHNGTVGKQVSRFQEFSYPWPEQGLLILSSDGLSTQWTLEPYPGLSRKHPSLIAGVLYRDFASRRDDVVVLVARERERIKAKGGGAI